MRSRVAILAMISLSGLIMAGCDDESAPCGGDAGDSGPCPEAAAPEVLAPPAPQPVVQPDGSIVLMAVKPACRDEMVFPNTDNSDKIPAIGCSSPEQHGVAVPYGDKRIAMLCACHGDPLKTDGGK